MRWKHFTEIIYSRDQIRSFSLGKLDHLQALQTRQIALDEGFCILDKALQDFLQRENPI